MRQVFSLLAMSIAAVLPAAAAQSQLPRSNLITDQRELLRGLGDISVSVSLPSEMSFSERTIQTNFELRLRQTGITVDERSGNELALTMTTMHNIDDGGRDLGSLIYSVDLDMLTMVQIADFRPEMRLTIAPVWSTSRFGIVGRSRTAEVRETLDDMMSRFLNDYLAVNPRR
ncbi:MAG TPA: hypothetical protein VG538_10785 [Vicinamibacterales bacterium]|jgi:hypothetical protein|nr:hypothetical protein [Vicinamibacterales bacterium]